MTTRDRLESGDHDWDSANDGGVAASASLLRVVAVHEWRHRCHLALAGGERDGVREGVVGPTNSQEERLSKFSY